MRIIGITGGIGSGKSAVLELLKNNFNAFIIKADDVAKETMEIGHAGYNKVLEIFGEQILDNDKNIVREKLAEIVFSNKNKLIVLNSIIHPLVKKLITEQIGQLKCEETYDYIFIEAALLIEDHYEILCDELWYIYASEDVRIQRLKASRGYDDNKIKEVFKNQLRPEEFKRHCKTIINNNKKLDDTLLQIKTLLTVKKSI